MTLQQFKALIEDRLDEADSGDPNKAPFGMGHSESCAWLQGKASALQWALEMMPTEAELAA
jgi:hypothetical protein